MQLPSPTDAARRAWRWLAARPPSVLLLAGWAVFGMCCYPGYLSYDSIEQLGQVRQGTFTDSYPPLMSQLWWLCEWVAAGPVPMLALQSGLMLFGGYGLLRRILAPRVAALSAVGVLLAPPVYAVMAVIWPDSLLAGVLVAATAALLDSRPRVMYAGYVLLVLACGCRPAIAPAIIPLVTLALPQLPRARRFAVATAIALGCAATAHVTSCALVDTPGYATESGLELVDIAGAARRAHLHGPELDTAFAGLEVVDRGRLAAWIDAGHDTYETFPLSHGDKRIVYPVADVAAAAAVDAAWRRMVLDHPRAYLVHRWQMFVRVLGFDDHWVPVFDDLGDLNQLVLLHHRATPSDVQLASRAVVRAVAETPLFKPWVYLVLAFAALYAVRRRGELTALVASGITYEIVQLLVASDVNYRASHWLVATVWLALVASAVARRWRNR